MSLRISYNKTATVERMVLDGSDVMSYEPHLINLPCHIQPNTGSLGQDIEGSFGKEWLMICDQADIIEGDRVTINGDVYRVTAVEQHDFLDHKHTEVILRIFKS
jgi:hypothetical protein